MRKRPHRSSASRRDRNVLKKHRSLRNANNVNSYRDRGNNATPSQAAADTTITLTHENAVVSSTIAGDDFGTDARAIEAEVESASASAAAPPTLEGPLPSLGVNNKRQASQIRDTFFAQLMRCSCCPLPTGASEGDRRPPQEKELTHRSVLDPLVLSNYGYLFPAAVYFKKGYLTQWVFLVISTVCSAAYHSTREHQGILAKMDKLGAVAAFVATVYASLALDSVVQLLLWMEIVATLCVFFFQPPLHSSGYERMHLIWHIGVGVGQIIVSGGLPV